MTRVLLLIKGLGRGGAEQLLVNAAPYLDRARFEYEIAYLLPHKNALVSHLESYGLSVTCLDGGRGLGWIRRLGRLVRERDIDVIHTHSPYPAVGARVRSAYSCAVVHTEHNVWERYGQATRWGNLITFGCNQRVFTVSNRVKESVRYPRYLNWLRMPPVETLYYGPDPQTCGNGILSDGVRREFGIPEDAPIVGTVANFKDHKRHDQLLAAAAVVLEKLPETRFMLVGQGPLEDRVRALAAEMGLSKSVVFTGFRDDAPRLMAAFDAFALSSAHEGLSIALLEAMALGKPPVVTRVGGLPEVISDGRDGFLVPSGDPVALAGALVHVLEDDALRARVGAAAARRAADFDIRKAVARTEQVYLEITG
jgi:glycosyltransferase involved in cell wall biosynthesis